MRRRTSMERSLAWEPNTAKLIANDELICYRKLGEPGALSQRTF